MSDGTEPFVSKVLDYARSNPEFAPKFMKVEDLEMDFNAVKDLQAIYRPLLQLVQQLDDTILMSGSEAYVSALAYYNSVKIGAKMNIPGAKSIYDDLKKRFVRAGNNVTAPMSDGS